MSHDISIDFSTKTNLTNLGRLRSTVQNTVLIVTTMSTTSTLNTMDSLLARIAVLEQKRYNNIPINEEDGTAIVVIDSSMRRARAAVEKTGCCYSAIWKFVPHSYYTWTLQQRATYLGSISGIGSLCKSLLMENRKVPYANDNDILNIDQTNPKFVLVIIQYCTILDVKKLTNCIRTLRKNINERIDSNQFEWRIANENDNNSITGYEHNSVTPFGLLNNSNIPIIVSSQAINNEHKFLYMGGGHVQLKLGISSYDFCTALQPIIADISQPRTEFDLQQCNLD